MAEKNAAKSRKFEALFDGDEINGKRYKLGDKITGLDAPTAEYLIGKGRIAELAGDEEAEDKPEAKKGK